jgi:hypothetical protein
MKTDHPVLTLSPDDVATLRGELISWLQQAKQKVNMNNLGARHRENYQSIANIEQRTRHMQNGGRLAIPMEDVWIVEEALGQKLMPTL